MSGNAVVRLCQVAPTSVIFYPATTRNNYSSLFNLIGHLGASITGQSEDDRDASFLNAVASCQSGFMVFDYIQRWKLLFFSHISKRVLPPPVLLQIDDSKSFASSQLMS